MKVVISVGYRDYVFAPEDAFTLMDLLERGERYEQKYHPETEDRACFTTHHIFENETEQTGTVKTLSEQAYRFAKLAGKP